MISKVIGLTQLGNAMGGIIGVLPKQMEKMLEHVSYEAEIIAKDHVPVRSGQLWCSIGNKAQSKGYFTQMPDTGKYASAKRQAKGKGDAIWRKRRIGADTEIVMGTKTTAGGKFYPAIIEFEEANPLQNDRGTHFMKNAADISDATVKKLFDNHVGNIIGNISGSSKLASTAIRGLGGSIGGKL